MPKTLDSSTLLSAAEPDQQNSTRARATTWLTISLPLDVRSRTAHVPSPWSRGGGLLSPTLPVAERARRIRLTGYRIAVIAGDGVGPEVVAEGCRVAEVAGSLYGIVLRLVDLPWGSAYYRRHGSMMPSDAAEQLAAFDAIYFGAVGAPDIPDEATAWGLIMPIRRAFDLYVNLRPIRLYPGVKHSLQNVGDLRVTFVRENTEGEYTQVGGRLHDGGPHALAVLSSIFSRRGVERILRYGFELGQREGLVTSVTKSNALGPTMGFWDEIAEEVATEFPGVPWERMHVDAAAYNLVRNPSRFRVIVASNLFGDILSDLGAGLQGSLGLSASANLNPETGRGMFEPVHGTAPDIAGRGIANPVGAVSSAALMFDHLGEPEAARAIERAVEVVLADGVHTPDLGGRATTRELGDALVDAVSGVGRAVGHS